MESNKNPYSSKVLFRTIEEALNRLRELPDAELTYHKPCISHPWRVIPKGFGIIRP